jgi:phosphate starvation-inducible PhoH-like protein
MSKNKSSLQTKEATLQVIDHNVFLGLAGDLDKNFKIIREMTEVEIGRDGHNLVIKGMSADVDLVHDLLSQLKGLVERGESLWQGDIERAIKMLSGNRKLRLEELFRDQLKIAGRKHSIVPKTFQQKNYLEAIKEHDVIFGIGPAGTGKTYLAMAMAVLALNNREVKRLVLCRPAVEAGEKLGFLPGDMAEKVNPYLRPLYDALHDMVEVERAKEMIEKGLVEVAPLAFMRGRTLSNSFVILDEAQNTTPAQMKMLLTRIGYKSKLVITGDISQVDLPRGVRSGLVEAVQILNHIDEISFIHFSEADVIRHPLISKIVKAYDQAGFGSDS